MSDEDDLFDDNPTRSKSSSLSKEKSTKKSQQPSSSTSVRKASLFFQPLVEGEHKLGCVLCFGGIVDLRRCRKCFLRTCLDCRKTIFAEQTVLENDAEPWLCPDCEVGGTGLDIHENGETRNKNRTVKTSTSKKRMKASGKKFRKRSS